MASRMRISSALLVQVASFTGPREGGRAMEKTGTTAFVRKASFLKNVLYLLYIHYISIILCYIYISIIYLLYIYYISIIYPLYIFQKEKKLSSVRQIHLACVHRSLKRKLDGG